MNATEWKAAIVTFQQLLAYTLDCTSADENFALESKYFLLSCFPTPAVFLLRNINFRLSWSYTSFFIASHFYFAHYFRLSLIPLGPRAAEHLPRLSQYFANIIQVFFSEEDAPISPRENVYQTAVFVYIL